VLLTLVIGFGLEACLFASLFEKLTP